MKRTYAEVTPGMEKEFWSLKWKSFIKWAKLYSFDENQNFDRIDQRKDFHYLASCGNLDLWFLPIKIPKLRNKKKEGFRNKNINALLMLRKENIQLWQQELKRTRFTRDMFSGYRKDFLELHKNRKNTIFNSVCCSGGTSNWDGLLSNLVLVSWEWEPVSLRQQSSHHPSDFLVMDIPEKYCFCFINAQESRSV